MNMDALIEEAHATATEKGWHDKPRSLAEEIALMHSELSEALEEVRHGTDALYTVDGKPEGVAAEFADVLIRIFDACKERGIPLSEALVEKMAYNKTRPYRHGGKAL